MKVYALPNELMETVPEHDYLNTNPEDWFAAEREHCEQICEWLRENGYRGKNTGRILQMPVADGYARYMVAEGSRSFLLYLPYGDGYDDPNVEFLPKKEVIKRIDERDRINKLFESKST